MVRTPLLATEYDKSLLKTVDLVFINIPKNTNTLSEVGDIYMKGVIKQMKMRTVTQRAFL